MENHLKSRPKKTIYDPQIINDLRDIAIQTILTTLLPNSAIQKIILIGSSVKDSFGEYEAPGFRGSRYSDFDFIVFTTNNFTPPLWLNREPDGKPFSQDEWNLAYRQKDFILDKFDAEIFFINTQNLTNPDFVEQAENAGIPLSESSSHQFLTVYQNDNYQS
jgi:hypothetical protein